MPWKASSVMEERLRFVARLLDGEAMTDVCREFGVSRKTGYKIFDRYKEHGLAALSDRSRRPVRYANQLPEQVESLIVRLEADKLHWGAQDPKAACFRRHHIALTPGRQIGWHGKFSGAGNLSKPRAELSRQMPFKMHGLDTDGITTPGVRSRKVGYRSSEKDHAQAGTKWSAMTFRRKVRALAFSRKSIRHLIPREVLHRV
jgi:transposase-like protein